MSDYKIVGDIFFILLLTYACIIICDYTPCTPSADISVKESIKRTFIALSTFVLISYLLLKLTPLTHIYDLIRIM